MISTAKPYNLTRTLRGLYLCMLTWLWLILTLFHSTTFYTWLGVLILIEPINMVLEAVLKLGVARVWLWLVFILFHSTIFYAWLGVLIPIRLFIMLLEAALKLGAARLWLWLVFIYFTLPPSKPGSARSTLLTALAYENDMRNQCILAYYE